MEYTLSHFCAISAAMLERICNSRHPLIKSCPKGLYIPGKTFRCLNTRSIKTLLFLRENQVLVCQILLLLLSMTYYFRQCPILTRGLLFRIKYKQGGILIHKYFITSIKSFRFNFSESDFSHTINKFFLIKAIMNFI